MKLLQKPQGSSHGVPDSEKFDQFFEDLNHSPGIHFLGGQQVYHICSPSISWSASQSWLGHSSPLLYKVILIRGIGVDIRSCQVRQTEGQPLDHVNHVNVCQHMSTSQPWNRARNLRFQLPDRKIEHPEDTLRWACHSPMTSQWFSVASQLEWGIDW